jgi:DNA polymerase theta
VYCAPTGGGKTLVAELAILRTVIIERKRAIFVLPFVSLVLEKVNYFKKLLLRLNRNRPKSQRIKVHAFYGDQSLNHHKYHVLICTIEKANGLVNSFIMTGMADRLGCVVMDEMHALGDSFNGYLLEILVRQVQVLVVLLYKLIAHRDFL